RTRNTNVLGRSIDANHIFGREAASRFPYKTARETAHVEQAISLYEFQHLQVTLEDREFRVQLARRLDRDLLAVSQVCARAFHHPHGNESAAAKVERACEGSPPKT